MSKAVPLSNEKRVENYLAQNGGTDELTVTQERSLRKAKRRQLKEKSA